MCSLCGVLAGRGHWTEPSSHPEAFEDRQATHTWHRERQDRTRLANKVLRHYGLALSDWSGSSQVLRGPTGKTVLVENLNEMWAAAEILVGPRCDPLDEALLAALEPVDDARG
jgi:hypothetical protein